MDLADGLSARRGSLEAAPRTSGRNEIRLVALGDAAFDAAPSERSPTGQLVRPLQTARLKGPDGELVLTIDGGLARVVASDATWEAMSEPVLLVVCLHWRFQAIDAEIDRLTAHAEGDIPHAVAMAIVASLRDRRRLLRHARDIRAVMIDLPHFAGPLTDPLPYLSTERAVGPFRSLAEEAPPGGVGRVDRRPRRGDRGCLCFGDREAQRVSQLRRRFDPGDPHRRDPARRACIPDF